MSVRFSVSALFVLTFACSPTLAWAGPDHDHDDGKASEHSHVDAPPATQAFYGDDEEPEIIKAPEEDHGHDHAGGHGHHDDDHGHPHDEDHDADHGHEHEDGEHGAHDHEDESDDHDHPHDSDDDHDHDDELRH